MRAGELEGAPPEVALRAVWGHAAFRPLQAEAVALVSGGGSCTVLAPTGGGKSLCFQVPSLVRPGVGLVVSPLLSLMQDQVDGLRERGVQAAMLGGGQDPGAEAETLMAAAGGGLDILYVSPERLERADFRAFASRARIALVAVDECHVVSSWGHDFRPSYRSIPAFLRLLPPGVPRVALTATADGVTLHDVRRTLGLDRAPVLTGPFRRDNIAISMRPMPDRRSVEEAAEAWAAARAGSCGIVYCRTRREAEAWAARLSRIGLPALPYHAGLEPDQRRAAQAFFMERADGVVCATVAFGMGIDKPGTRWVLHVGLPSSPESYAQEIGRAGRDGGEAEAAMFWCEADLPRGRALLEAARLAREEEAGEAGLRPTESESWCIEGRRDHGRAARQRFETMAALARSAHCRPRALAAWMGDGDGPRCGKCDACTSPPPTEDHGREAEAVLSLLEAAGRPLGGFRICETLLGTGGPDDLGLEPHSGRLSELSRREILHAVGQMLAGGVLQVPPEAGGALALTESGAMLLAAAREEPLVFPMVPCPAPPAETDIPRRRGRANPDPAPGLDWQGFLARVAARAGRGADEILPPAVVRALERSGKPSQAEAIALGVPPALVALCRAEWAEFLGWEERAGPAPSGAKPRWGRK